jgi:hypothetical protein
MRPALTLLLCGVGFNLHPLHTTHTDLVEDHGQVVVQVRAFPDDLHSAVQKREGAADDSATARYLREKIELLDASSHSVPLTWLGREMVGEVVLLRLRAIPQGGLQGTRVRQMMHMELFDDQVNVVQASYGGRKVSLLFVPGDAPKRLP